MPNWLVNIFKTLAKLVLSILVIIFSVYISIFFLINNLTNADKVGKALDSSQIYSQLHNTIHQNYKFQTPANKTELKHQVVGSILIDYLSQEKLKNIINENLQQIEKYLKSDDSDLIIHIDYQEFDNYFMVNIHTKIQELLGQNYLQVCNSQIQDVCINQKVKDNQTSVSQYYGFNDLQSFYTIDGDRLPFEIQDKKYINLESININGFDQNITLSIISEVKTSYKNLSTHLHQLSLIVLILFGLSIIFYVLGGMSIWGLLKNIFLYTSILVILLNSSVSFLIYLGLINFNAQLDLSLSSIVVLFGDVILISILALIIASIMNIINIKYKQKFTNKSIAEYKITRSKLNILDEKFKDEVENLEQVVDNTNKNIQNSVEYKIP